MYSGRMSSDNQKPGHAAMALLALGVVFGDIGTSPLYAFEAALSMAGAGSAVGVASLILWTVFLVVTIKYAAIVMRADYHGEGGIFALMALLRTSGKSWAAGGFLTAMVVFGAAMLLGDGAITPAISVLSAVEGLAAVHPGWGHFSLPAAVVILTALFCIQRLGTGRLGGVFGPVMLLWFLCLAAIGAVQIARFPGVLRALDPREGIHLLATAGWGAWAILGAVVLAVTGAEALYADLGHFGRKPILRAWRFVVFPALILNYLGQAALVLRHPDAAQNPNLFFLLIPEGAPRAALVILATLATVIASQALISAVFSLASQAMDLGFLPRFFVQHTSTSIRGQIYIPLVNFLLGSVCLFLVVAFRNSAALANAYGIAVTCAMAVTSVAFGAVLFSRGILPTWQAAALTAGLLCLDLPLFGACLTKLFEGGFVPVLLAIALGAVMLTWRRGRLLIRRTMKFGTVSVEELGRRLEGGEFQRVEGTEIFVVRRPNPEHAVACILEQNRRVKVLGRQLVILLLDPEWENPSENLGEVKVSAHDGGLWVVRGAHGYMAEPDVPSMMKKAADQSGGKFQIDPEDSFFVIARELIVSCPEKLMPFWQRHLFAFMSRNVVPGPHYLNIPPDRLIIYTWLLRL
ncbi:MAG: potassium transporter Kup [Verrucomicrobiaceae bacterium]|nr:MAG: potassium transporter Kup [Verrucomicrobiaceae bacterium]